MQDRAHLRSTTDCAFDRLIPEDVRYLSRLHWTPVHVAIRASTLLCATAGSRVLDVGAGVGKLCTIGALSAAGTWCGVEHHELLVSSARQLARALGVGGRTIFVHGDAFSIDWTAFDAIYLYNPFELPLFDLPDPDAHEADVRAKIARVQGRLEQLRPGTRVVTFHGFGGVMPRSYELLYQERIPAFGDLVLWIQRARFAGSV